MTPTPPPVPVHLATDAARQADDLGVLLFIAALALVAAVGWLRARAREGEREGNDG